MAAFRSSYQETWVNWVLSVDRCLDKTNRVSWNGLWHTLRKTSRMNYPKVSRLGIRTPRSKPRAWLLSPQCFLGRAKVVRYFLIFPSISTLIFPSYQVQWIQYWDVLDRPIDYYISHCPLQFGMFPACRSWVGACGAYQWSLLSSLWSWRAVKQICSKSRLMP